MDWLKVEGSLLSCYGRCVEVDVVDLWNEFSVFSLSLILKQ